MSDTVKVYDAMVEDYARIAEDLPSTLGSFLNHLAPKSRVLDLGCGPGHHARIIAEHGHLVVAADASSEMVKKAKQQSGVDAKQATFDDIRDLGIFDGIWASFSLLHAPRDKFAGYIADIHAISAPGALFTLSLKTGSGEAVDKLGRFYSYFSQDELTNILRSAGFEVGTVKTGKGAGLAGNVEPWICIEAHA